MSTNDPDEDPASDPSDPHHQDPQPPNRDIDETVGDWTDRTIPDLENLNDIPTDDNRSEQSTEILDSVPEVTDTVEIVDDEGGSIISSVPVDPATVKKNRDVDFSVQPLQPFGISDDNESSQELGIERTLDYGSLVSKVLDGSNPAETTEGFGLTQYLQTVELEDDTSEVAAGASVLDGDNTNQTIDPKDLDDEEAALWDSLAGTFSGDSTRNIPAIEKSISETKLQIRSRDIATPRMDEHAPVDYRLVRLLGRGGMGNVFLAKQQSLDRTIAVKIIKPLDDKKRQTLKRDGRLEQVEADRRHQFLSEAVVTGDLDHPNIVPIYDIAVTADNTLFYGMKRVVGTPWSDVIGDHTLEENLDVFLKVCDAVGFAHTRGVIHRDIKPENVMLGDFGVVMVMDWGMALAKPEFEKLDSIAHSAGLGGTPAFMAPEMATGPVDKINAASDVYLLGATLFLIITGKTPHQADGVKACVRAAARNEIIEVETQHKGELLDIALKAMETDPADRFSDVRALQTAVRGYRSHAESILLTRRATQGLQQAVASQDYAQFARSTFRFEEAISLWAGNEAAASGLSEAKLQHAEVAYLNDDFELGLSVLDPENPAHQPTLKKLHEGISERQRRAQRLNAFRKAVAAMLVFIIVGGSVAMYLILESRKAAVAARDEATENAAEAVRQRDAADQQRQRAENSEQAERSAAELARQNEAKAIENAEQAKKNEKAANAFAMDAIAQETFATQLRDLAEFESGEADRLRDLAEQNLVQADLQRQRAEENARKVSEEKQKVDYEFYLSKIALAKEQVDRNEFSGARTNLDLLRQQRGAKSLGWEWRWLDHLCQESLLVDQMAGGYTDVAIHPSLPYAVGVSESGDVRTVALQPTGAMQQPGRVALPNAARATSVSISPNGNWLAIGDASGTIHLWNGGLSQYRGQLTGHEGPISGMTFDHEGRLYSGSRDRTARIWHVARLELLETVWHFMPVVDLAYGQRGPNDRWLVCAASDDRIGRAVVWHVESSPDSSKIHVSRQGEFLAHAKPVTAVAISDDGRWAASGDAAGNLAWWSPGETTPTDYTAAVKVAVQGVVDPTANKAPTNGISVRHHWISALDTSTPAARSSLANPNGILGPAHADSVNDIAFNRTGDQLITASDDYTLKLWDTGSLRHTKTLRGHGGWVTRARFMPGTKDQVLSVSRDGAMRRWVPNEYVGQTVQWTSSPRTRDNDAGDSIARAHADEILAASLDSSGKRLVTTSRDRTARLLKINDNGTGFQLVAELRDESPEGELSEGTVFVAMSAVVDQAHQKLYIGSADGTIRVWDLQSGTELATARGTGLNQLLAISKDGTRMLSMASDPNEDAVYWQLDPTGKSDPRRIFALQKHQLPVSAFDISPDGRWLFTADRGGTGYLWDAMSKKTVGHPWLICPEFRINRTIFSRDGTQLLVGSDNHQLTVFDVQSRRVLNTMTHQGPVSDLTLSHDGRFVATLSDNKTLPRGSQSIQVWDLQQPEKPFFTTDNSTRDGSNVTTAISSLRFNQSTQQLIVVSTNPSLQNREISTYQVAQLIAGNHSPEQTLSLPSKLGETQLALGLSATRMLTLSGEAGFLWDLNRMTHLRSFRSHASVNGASFSFDGRYVATGSRSVRIWDTQSGKSVAKIESPHNSVVRSVVFSPIGPSYEIATAGDDGLVKVWTVDPEKSTSRLKRDYDLTDNGSQESVSIRDLDYAPDASAILVVGDRGLVRWWNFTDDKLCARLDLESRATVLCGCVSSDGKWIAVGDDEPLAHLYRITPDQRTPVLAKRFSGHSGKVEDIHVLVDGTEQLRVFTASRDKSMRVWDASSDGNTLGREILALRRHSQGVTAVDATNDGQLILTAGRDGNVILWPASQPNQ